MLKVASVELIKDVTANDLHMEMEVQLHIFQISELYAGDQLTYFPQTVENKPALPV